MKGKNFDEHVWLEDIIYCPSQIYYYFSSPGGEKAWCLYIRQRRMPEASIEIVEVDPETQEFPSNYPWPSVTPSRPYDINNQPGPEEENKEIMALEKEALEYLRQSFPEVEFPENPERRSRFLRDI